MAEVLPAGLHARSVRLTAGLLRSLEETASTGDARNTDPDAMGAGLCQRGLAWHVCHWDSPSSFHGEVEPSSKKPLSMKSPEEESRADSWKSRDRNPRGTYALLVIEHHISIKSLA